MNNRLSNRNVILVPIYYPDGELPSSENSQHLGRLALLPDYTQNFLTLQLEPGEKYEVIARHLLVQTIGEFSHHGVHLKKPTHLSLSTIIEKYMLEEQVEQSGIRGRMQAMRVFTAHLAPKETMNTLPENFPFALARTPHFGPTPELMGQHWYNLLNRPPGQPPASIRFWKDPNSFEEKSHLFVPGMPTTVNEQT